MKHNKNTFEYALAAEGVSGPLADLARSVYKQESDSGKDTKTSNAGAVGGMQVRPATFKSVADKGWAISDPVHNARAGIRYLGQMFKQADGDPALAAAGYYGGPTGLEKARLGIAVSDPRNPKAPNTLQYGQQVASRVNMEKYPINIPLSVPRVVTPSSLPVQTPFQGYAQAPQAPVVAQAPIEVPTPQLMVQAPSMAPQVPVEAGPDPWQQFLQAGRNQQVAPSDLAYGPRDVQIPNFMTSVQQPAQVVPQQIRQAWGEGQQVNPQVAQMRKRMAEEEPMQRYEGNTNVMAMFNQLLARQQEMRA